MYWAHNSRLQHWIEETKALCKPQSVHLCDGSQEEYDLLCQKMVDTGTFIKLNPAKRPNSYLARSSPDDVARVEESTFICSKSQEDAGPTNQWQDPKQMKRRLLKLFSGCMRGRTMYVIPYCMGPLGSMLSRIGVQITDSPYAVCNMRIMTRMGSKVLSALKNEEFIPGLHSVGAPLNPHQKDVPWPCNPQKLIVHFPEEKLIWSFGSGYGGNALLGKKCFALRIASCLARDEEWLAEHMLILGITDPKGKKIYMAGAFPSGCGKTNLAMLTPTLPGWTVETVGDDIAWMAFAKDGTLRAINPEFGFFGIAPGTSMSSNPKAMRSIESNVIFTNVALTDDGDVWWEGMTQKPPEHLIDWRGKDWTPSSPTKAAHPNARFTAPIMQCPAIDPAVEDPSGVPISAILFGGRRSSVTPLVCESLNWQHGTFYGVSIVSETTAAAAGTVGKLRHDPFAMLPFCGYNMADYFQHWLKMGEKANSNLPKIYYVNWFRKGKNGAWLWPGFGDNSRVLKWIFERVSQTANAIATPIGNVPDLKNFDMSGLQIEEDVLKELFNVDKNAALKDLEEMEKYLATFKNRLPLGILDELRYLKIRLEQ